VTGHQFRPSEALSAPVISTSWFSAIVTTILAGSLALGIRGSFRIRTPCPSVPVTLALVLAWGEPVVAAVVLADGLVLTGVGELTPAAVVAGAVVARTAAVTGAAAVVAAIVLTVAGTLVLVTAAGLTVGSSPQAISIRQSIIPNIKFIFFKPDFLLNYS